MSDWGLFVVMPVAAVMLALPAGLLRYIHWRRQPAVARALSISGRTGGAAAFWWAAISVVLVAHLLALALPGSLLLWNRRPARLLLLEGAGLLGGALALSAFVLMTLAGLRASRPRGARAALDVVAGTLVAIELVTGLAMAMLYRWGSSWSAVTLAPYLRSLLHMKPAVQLVAGLPFLVRLHVVCAFALLAVTPFTGMARILFAAVDRLTRWLGAPVAGIGHAARSTVDSSSAARVDTGEEN